MELKLAIGGSRTIQQVNIARIIEDNFADPDVIITGGAKGVDSIAEDFARSHGIELVIFRPDYKAHLRGAPIRRNERIVNECSYLLAIWDGKSKGTRYTINYAIKMGKPVHVVRV